MKLFHHGDTENTEKGKTAFPVDLRDLRDLRVSVVRRMLKYLIGNLSGL